MGPKKVSGKDGSEGVFGGGWNGLNFFLVISYGINCFDLRVF